MRVVAEDLVCRRSGRTIFAGVSFTLSDGEALIVTGRNGAGKSSLLAMLTGTLRPAEGRLAAQDVGERTLPECLHMVGHREALKSALTARENLAVAQALLGSPRLSPDEALERVGLVHVADLPTGYLSAGQKRRVALARLLVAHRPLWLLDEPTSALDTASQETLFGFLGDHLAGGGLIIAATHTPLPIAGARGLRIERAALAEEMPL